MLSVQNCMSFGKELQAISSSTAAEQRETAKDQKERLEKKVRADAESRFDEYLKRCRHEARQAAKASRSESVTMDHFEDTSDYLYQVHAWLAHLAIERLRRDGTRAETAYDTDKPVGSDPLYDYVRHGIGVRIRFG